MVTKKEIKQSLKNEFDSILPNVLIVVEKTKVIPSPLGFDINLKNRILINTTQLVLASSVILAIASYGGYSYYTPNTIMSINVNPTLLNAILNLKSDSYLAFDENQNVNITLAINDYERVVEVEADSNAYHQALNNLGIKNMNYQQALQKTFLLLNENGSIDIDSNLGQVMIMVLDPNSRRIEKFNNYINQNLSKDIGIKNKTMIKTEKVDFTSSVGLSPSVHPAKAMAIREIMLQTNRYSFEELARMDKMELIKVMMEIKRSKR